MTTECVEVHIVGARSPQDARERAEREHGGRVVNWRRRTPADALDGYIVTLEREAAENTDMLRPLLTNYDISILNRARTILTELVAETGRRSVDALVSPPAIGSGTPDAEDFGYLRAYAEQAENALFLTIARAHHHAGVPMTDDQIHNREPEVRSPETDRPATVVGSAFIGDGQPAFQGDSPGEHDWRL